MQLEDFRDNDIGMPALLCSTQPPLTIYLCYDLYAALGYQFTIKCLSELEASIEELNNGTLCHPAISMWYLSVSSFISALLKVLCIKNGADYQQLSFLPLNVRYQAILTLASIHSKTSAELIVSDKIEDLQKIYSSLHLDVSDSEKLIYKTANFSGRPFFINQVDVLQSLLIALEVFEKLRFIISGLDLMPNISLMTSSMQVVFDKLSLLKANVIIPAVNDILVKHKLKINLNLSEVFSNYDVSNVFEEKQVLAAFKYIEDEKFKIPLGSAKTDILSRFHSSFMKKFQGQEQKFKRNYLSRHVQQKPKK